MGTTASYQLRNRTNKVCVRLRPHVVQVLNYLSRQCCMNVSASGVNVHAQYSTFGVTTEET